MSTSKKFEKEQQHINAIRAAISGTTENGTFTRDLLTKDEFRERIGAESTRLVDELIRRKKIPVIRLGHRTVRIPWVRALQALGRLEIRAVGQSA